MRSTSCDEGSVRKPSWPVTGLSWGGDTGTEGSHRSLGHECKDLSSHRGDVHFYFEQGGKPLENLGQRIFLLTSHVTWNPLATLLKTDCDCKAEAAMKQMKEDSGLDELVRLVYVSDTFG